MERFNAIMVDVYRDREANGTTFDHVFKEEMISRYGKKPANENVDEDHAEQIAAESRRVVMVYSD